MNFFNWIALFVYDYVPVDGCIFALSGIMCCIYSNVSNVWQVCSDLFLKLKWTYLKQEKPSPLELEIWNCKYFLYQNMYKDLFKKFI